MMEFVALGGALDQTGKKRPIGDSAYALFHKPSESVLLVDCGLYNLSWEAQQRQSGALSELKSSEQVRRIREGDSLSDIFSLTSAPLPQDELNADYFPNLEPLYGAKNIYAVATHGHNDHIGALPFLWRQFRNMKLFATAPTKDICAWAWSDYLGIARKRKVQPLYNGPDKETLKKQMHIVAEEVPFQAGPFELAFYRAGHIGGAISLYVKVRGSNISIFFSGDISVVQQRTVGRAKLPKGSVDYLVLESTYGTKNESSRMDVEAAFVSDVRRVLEDQGRVICPAFAVGRAAELFEILKAHGITDQYPVYIDGAACEISGIYLKYGFVSKGVTDHFILRKGGRDRIMYSQEPCVIISPSGMMLPGTLSSAYALPTLSNPKNLIALTSYQDPCSPGSRILGAELGKKITLDGFDVDRYAAIKQYSLSAHAEGSGLLSIADDLSATETFLVHGTEENMEALIAASGRSLRKTYINQTYQL